MVFPTEIKVTKGGEMRVRKNVKNCDVLKDGNKSKGDQ